MTEQATVQALSRLLADSYTLYLKTQNFHWNVTGPQFVALHTLFEQQYTELAMAADEIAERIRALGAKAPGSYTEFAALATVREATGEPSAEEMIRILRDDNATVARTANDLLSTAGDAGDDVSADLGTQRQTVHEKSAWMLGALLQ